MALGFIIPNAESYNGTGGDIEVLPDNVMSRSSSPVKLLVEFGDGYEQRAVKGINPVKETFTVSFNNRQKSEIDDIVSFFEARLGVTKFVFKVPDTNSSGNEKSINVVCENYSTTYNNANFYSCSSTFRRVYEA